MKKIMLIAAMMVMTIAASAQVYVGGTLGLGTNSTKVGDGDAVNTTAFSINPEIGYNISSDFAIGVGLGYTSSKVEDNDAVSYFSIVPYLRYTFAELSDNVKLFAEGAFEYDSYSNDLPNAWGVGIRPGILVNLSDKLQFVGRITLFSYSSTTEDPKTKATQFAFNPTDLQLGIQYNF